MMDWGMQFGLRPLDGAGGGELAKVSHNVVDPHIIVFFAGVHQEHCQPPLADLTQAGLDLRPLVHALHLGHKRTLLHVVPEHHGRLLRPPPMGDTWGRRGEDKTTERREKREEEEATEVRPSVTW